MVEYIKMINFRSFLQVLLLFVPLLLLYFLDELNLNSFNYLKPVMLVAASILTGLLYFENNRQLLKKDSVNKTWMINTISLFIYKAVLIFLAWKVSWAQNSYGDILFLITVPLFIVEVVFWGWLLKIFKAIDFNFKIPAMFAIYLGLFVLIYVLLPTLVIDLSIPLNVSIALNILAAIFYVALISLYLGKPSLTLLKIHFLGLLFPKLFFIELALAVMFFTSKCFSIKPNLMDFILSGIIFLSVYVFECAVASAIYVYRTWKIKNE